MEPCGMARQSTGSGRMLSQWGGFGATDRKHSALARPFFERLFAEIWLSFFGDRRYWMPMLACLTCSSVGLALDYQQIEHSENVQQPAARFRHLLTHSFCLQALNHYCIFIRVLTFRPCDGAFMSPVREPFCNRHLTQRPVIASQPFSLRMGPVQQAYERPTRVGLR
jgi:hypothetical protein